MDFLKAEIEAKRRAAEELKQSAPSAVKTNKKRYVRRGDLEKLQEQKKQKIDYDSQSASNGATTSDEASPDLSKHSVESPQQTKLPKLPMNEVAIRLRRMGLVLTLVTV